MKILHLLVLASLLSDFFVETKKPRKQPKVVDKTGEKMKKIAKTHGSKRSHQEKNLKFPKTNMWLNKCSFKEEGLLDNLC